MGLRPLKDSTSMSFASTVFRMATSVAIGVASEVTVTVSVRPPASSVKVREIFADASSGRSVTTAFLNPSSSADTS